LCNGRQIRVPQCLLWATHNFCQTNSQCSHGNRIPPIIHSTQVQAGTIAEPLANCLRLARVCDPALPGGSPLAVQLVEQEMSRLYDAHATYDARTLLAALQAYLLYIIMLTFQLEQRESPVLRQAVMNLQEMTSISASHGTSAGAERRQTQTSWHDWVHVESKRRTIFTMYLLDNYLCIVDKVPVFLGTELRGLLAPSSAALWQASDGHAWQMKWNGHLSEWPTAFLTIDELWAPAPDVSVAQLQERNARVDKWLEGVDEYGTMLCAITTVTHAR
jgi:hypothetical protein